MQWISLVEALAKIGGRAMKGPLGRALLAGDVIGRQRAEDGAAAPLDPHLWRPDRIDWENGTLAVRVDGPDGVVNIPVSVEINQRSLRAEFDRATNETPKNVGGRPPKWDWEEFWLELCARLHDDGLPETQAEMVRRMGQWFIDQRGDHPADSEIKKRASRLWRRLGRS